MSVKCRIVPAALYFYRLQGKPRPVATWSKDGVLLEDKTVGTRTSDVDAILFIRSAERTHSGKYTLSVRVEDTLDSADLHIQVVGQFELGATRLGRNAGACHAVNNLFGSA